MLLYCNLHIICSTKATGEPMTKLSVEFANNDEADYCRYVLALLQTLDLALENDMRPLEADASSL